MRRILPMKNLVTEMQVVSTQQILPKEALDLQQRPQYMEEYLDRQIVDQLASMKNNLMDLYNTVYNIQQINT